LTLWGRDPARLDAVAAQCRALGASVDTRVLDLTDAAAVAPAIDADDARPPRIRRARSPSRW